MHFALNPANTDVLFCDYSSGELECSVASDGFKQANGITGNKDLSKIFVADAIERSITVLERDKFTN